MAMPSGNYVSHYSPLLLSTCKQFSKSLKNPVSTDVEHCIARDDCDWLVDTQTRQIIISSVAEGELLLNQWSYRPVNSFCVITLISRGGRQKFCTGGSK